MKNLGRTIVNTLDILLDNKKHVEPKRLEELEDLTQFVRIWFGTDPDGLDKYANTLMSNNENIIDGLIRVSKGNKFQKRYRIYI